MRATRGTAQTIAIAGGIGAVSGFLAYLVPEALEAAGIDRGGAVLAWLLRLWPGIVFGAAIGLYLKIVDVATIPRAAAFVPLDTAAWYAALWFAINSVDKLGFPFDKLWQLGIASGLIGASLVSLSALLLFPYFRRWDSVLAMIVTGGAVGVVLGIGVKGWELVVLFTLWQGAVAACFGWAVARARRAL